MIDEVVEQLKILCIADDDKILTTIEQDLKNKVKELEIVLDNKNALEKYNSFKPDLVILDIKAQDSKVLDLFKSIRQKSLLLPIIILLNNNEFDILTKTLEIGVSGYVLKPIDKNKLFDIIKFFGKSIVLEKELDTRNKQLILQSRMVAMGEMVGNIAHQWRQPLSVISTGATGMKMKKEYDVLEDDEFYSICDAINENAQYLSQTIDDFRNFIKGDTKAVRFDLKNDTDSFIKLVDSTIKKYNIQVILNLKENLKVQGYPNELIQCFINIFNNAKDALIENNSEDNRLICISQIVEDNMVVIEFKDNAGGIPDDIIDKVFEPYFTTKHQKQGTGLGLHMSYNLVVNGMKGNIEVKNDEFEFNSKKYKGAKFIIKIPLA